MNIIHAHLSDIRETISKEDMTSPHINKVQVPSNKLRRQKLLTQPDWSDCLDLRKYIYIHMCTYDCVYIYIFTLFKRTR